MEHKDDGDDRCVCGGLIVYFEDAPVPGEGCDVEGHPWYVPEIIADAYEWLSDILPDIPAFPSDAEIILNINRLYEGGWSQFVKDNT